MKQILALLAAAALGSAATYFIMEARLPTATAQVTAEKVAAPKFSGKTVAPNGDAPAGEAPRKTGNNRFGGKGGFLPEEIDGVTPEQMNKCRAALFKTFQDEGVKAARAKQAELRKEAEYASDDEKKALRTQFEEAQLEIRKATKAAMLAADADLSEEVVDKVLDAIEERLKQRAQQFQQNAKKK